MPATLKTSEFDFHTDERDWAAVKIVIDEVDEEMCEKESAVLKRLVVWMTGVKIFKKTVMDKMILREPTSRDTGFHRSSLAFLKGAGRRLLHEIQGDSENDPKYVGVSWEDAAAIVEELEYQEREWYGDMKDAMRNEILKELELA